MTVQYRDRNSLTLLFRWHGSVWQNLWLSYLIFMAIYAAINLSYRHAFSDEMRESFEEVVKTAGKFSRIIPITFLLGFYVSTIVRRWWDQLFCVAWPDKLMNYTTAFLPSNDPRMVEIRRTIARYCCLTSLLVWSEVSISVRKRFPTVKHLHKAGMFNDEEFKLYEQTNESYGKWFTPVSWTVTLLNTLLATKRITERGHQKLIDEMWAFRDSCFKLSLYDWMNIPLVYTQVVTVGTYGYFLYCLIARQSLGEFVWYDLALRLLFTTLEFVFYVGWFKVGEELRCPFGADDEDFDMNYIVDRNLHVALMMVDDLHRQQPPILKDAFWGQSDPKLPHTRASVRCREYPPHWSLSGMRVKDQDALIVPLSVTHIEEQEKLLNRSKEEIVMDDNTGKHHPI